MSPLQSLSLEGKKAKHHFQTTLSTHPPPPLSFLCDCLSIATNTRLEFLSVNKNKQNNHNKTENIFWYNLNNLQLKKRLINHFKLYRSYIINYQLNGVHQSFFSFKHSFNDKHTLVFCKNVIFLWKLGYAKSIKLKQIYFRFWKIYFFKYFLVILSFQK